MRNKFERIFSEINNLDQYWRKDETGNSSLSVISTLPDTMTNMIRSFFNVFPNVKILLVPLSNEN